jgi:hypothetical protein
VFGFHSFRGKCRKYLLFMDWSVAFEDVSELLSQRVLEDLLVFELTLAASAWRKKSEIECSPDI